MDNRFFPSGVAGIDRSGYDAGLRAHMQRIYNYMAVGLAVTGGVAWIFAHTALMQLMLSPLRWLVIFAPVAIVLYISVGMQGMKTSTLKALFWTYCALMGVSMSALFFMYDSNSIARAFVISGATFGGMSLWGYTTKKDLSGMGSFLMMGVMGLVIASLVNLFMASPMLYWVTSVMGVGIFAGLTAFDTQMLKEYYAESWGADANEKVAVMGAMRLYMDFINMFIFLLRLTGVVRSNNN